MKAFKLVLAGVAILVCAMLLVTKGNLAMMVVNKNTTVQLDSVAPIAEDADMSAYPIGMPIAMPY